MFMMRFACLSVGLLLAYGKLGGYCFLLTPFPTKFSPKAVGVPRLRCSGRGDIGVRSLHCDATSSLIEVRYPRLRTFYRNNEVLYQSFRATLDLLFANSQLLLCRQSSCSYILQLRTRAVFSSAGQDNRVQGAAVGSTQRDRSTSTVLSAE